METLWKGERQSATNALIDDLRIIEQLYRAYEMYKEERYKNLADRLSDAVLRYNKKIIIMLIIMMQMQGNKIIL